MNMPLFPYKDRADAYGWAVISYEKYVEKYNGQQPIHRIPKYVFDKMGGDYNKILHYQRWIPGFGTWLKSLVEFEGPEEPYDENEWFRIEIPFDLKDDVKQKFKIKWQHSNWYVEGKNYLDCFMYVMNKRGYV